MTDNRIDELINNSINQEIRIASLQNSIDQIKYMINANLADIHRGDSVTYDMVELCNRIEGIISVADQSKYYVR